MWTPFGIDSLRLFTPISAVGVFYIVYATMKTITQVGGQYAIKVSYSKDKVKVVFMSGIIVCQESEQLWNG